MLGPPTAGARLDPAIRPSVGARDASSLDGGPNPNPLLCDKDPAPYRIVNPGGRSRILLTCDHASCAIPQALGTLGISHADLTRHIGWDPGSRAVTARLAKLLDAPAVLSGFSRLVIDCNRKPGSTDSIRESSDGTMIPGNAGVTTEESRRRADALFHPYHAAITRTLDSIRRRGTKPVYIAIHTFTPSLDGVFRPWHFGVLWDEDPILPRSLIEALRAQQGGPVGDNQPYRAPDRIDFSQEFHAWSAGLNSALIEIRSDLVRDGSGVATCADIIAEAIETAMPAIGRTRGNSQ